MDVDASDAHTLSLHDALPILLRMKDDYDGAEPSGNSVAAIALIKLAELTGRDDLRACAESTVNAFAGKLAEYPHAMPLMLVAYGMLLEPPADVVIVGGHNEQLRRALEQRFIPNHV